MITSAERRAYINTARRSQPLAELQRKAAKSARRKPWTTMECNDVALHEIWRSDRQFAHTATDPGGFCYLCSAFGIWDRAAERYVAGPLHDPRCCFAPDDGPYPGWTAAGRSRPQTRANLAPASSYEPQNAAHGTAREPYSNNQSIRAALAAAEGRPHASDCAVHNAPALPVGACDCEAGSIPTKPGGR